MTGEEAIRILYIEDDPEAFILFQTVMKRTMHIKMDIHWASTGQEALKILRRKSFDLIFLDYRLPDYDGLAILDKLHEERITSPVVMLTGQGSEEVASAAFKKGVIDYLSKCFNSLEELAANFRSYVDFALYMAQVQQELHGPDGLTQKRDSHSILADILQNAINGAKKTHLLQKANLNSESIKKYLWYALKNEYLQWRRGEQGGIFITTPKGMALLGKMSEVSKMLA